MNKKLEQKYLRLEHSRHALLELLNKTEAVLLETSPIKGKWSVTQIMYHLNQAETLSVIYVSKKMKGSAVMKNSGLMAALRLLLLNTRLLIPLKYKAPKVLGEVPVNVRYSDIKEQWNETRKKLKELLESIPENDLKKELFKQPIVGRMNIYQMLEFMQRHFDRHAKQMLERIK